MIEPSQAKPCPGHETVPRVRWLVASESIGVAVLVLVVAGTCYSRYAIGVWFAGDPAAAESVVAWPLVAAALWPFLHAGAWFARRALGGQLYNHLAAVLMVVNLLCAPVLVYYAWLVLASAVIWSVA